MLLLLGGAFGAGFLVRDYVDIQGATSESSMEETVDEVVEPEREVLLDENGNVIITASMHLESIIEKGKAENTKSIKLEHIDDVSKLIEFPNLRRIRLYDMTGDEDLSVIQELKGVEEITIENSVIKDQFTNGSFDSVTYIEMYDCRIEEQSQFGNFKGLTQLYVFFAEFASSDGNLELTSYLPEIQELTLSNCGAYDELLGVKDLSNLRTLSLTNGTMISNMTYIENDNIESVKMDMSFTTDIDEFNILADLENIKSISVQVADDHMAAGQLSRISSWLKRRHPGVTIRTSTY